MWYKLLNLVWEERGTSHYIWVQCWYPGLSVMCLFHERGDVLSLIVLTCVDFLFSFSVFICELLFNKLLLNFQLDDDELNTTDQTIFCFQFDWVLECFKYTYRFMLSTIMMVSKVMLYNIKLLTLMGMWLSWGIIKLYFIYCISN